MVHSISILGSTGSIGRQTVAVAEHLGLNVRALTTNRNIQLAEEQARRLHPAFFAVNLAVMNMLPLPALDGGRVFCLLVTWVLERISRRKIDPKYEGYIHTAGLVLLLALMAYVMYNDISKLVT